jgi:hypothetical protein
MMEVQNFVATLAKATKSLREIKSSKESAFGEKNMPYSLIRSCIKAAKKEKKNQMKRTANVVVAITSAI